MSSARSSFVYLTAHVASPNKGRSVVVYRISRSAYGIAVCTSAYTIPLVALV